MRYFSLLLAAMAAAVATPDSAQAFYGYGLGSGSGIGIGGLYRSLDFPTERRVPYFAAHPPVYYSQPVPRTYGYSPFAYTPTTLTPDVVSATQPLTINNPYVQPSNVSNVQSVPAPNKASKTPKSRTISTGVQVKPTGPLTIINPYVRGEI